MSTSITVKCNKKSVEKSWQTDAKGKSLNRHTLEFEVGYGDGPGEAAEKFEGSTLTLVTLDEKLAKEYKVGDECTMSIKAK